MTYRSDFASRHIGPNQYQIQTMLLELGYKDLDAFIKAVVPENIHIKGEIEKVLPVGISEVAAIEEIAQIAKKNTVVKSFIGNGYYGTITPPLLSGYAIIAAKRSFGTESLPRSISSTLIFKGLALV